MRNYSKQREAILEVLCSTTAHPTVNWIYERTREKLPKISLGTVYRNLAELKAEGRIIEVPVQDGFQHFDGNPLPHLHFHCRTCGGIYDCVSPDSKLKAFLENELGCAVEEESLVFSGVCKGCGAEHINNN